jgi:hypothetical protein
MFFLSGIGFLFKVSQDRRTDVIGIAGGKDEENVPRAELGQEDLAAVFEGRGETSERMAHLRYEIGGRETFFRLTRSENFGNQDPIGVAKRGEKFGQQRAGA